MLNTNLAEITIKDIKDAPTRNLVNLYNEISGKPIKKFSSRSVGEERIWNLIQQKKQGVVEKAKEKSNKQSPKKRETYESKIIKILKTENPKRPNSRAFEKFAILLKMDGKTIKELKAHEGKHPKLDTEEGWPATELRWALKLGLVKLINGE